MSHPLQPQPARTADVRWLLTLVTVTLGGYLLVLSLSGQVTQILSGAELGLSFGAASVYGGLDSATSQLIALLLSAAVTAAIGCACADAAVAPHTAACLHRAK